MTQFLYHYTNDFARKAICETLKLRLTMTSCSKNDFMDTIYIKEVVNNLRKQYSGNNIFIKEAYETIFSILDCESYESNNFLESKIFMFCLSNARNDEGMKKFGNIFIIFRKDILIDCFSKIAANGLFYEHFESANVVYDVHLQEKAIEKLVLQQEQEYIEYLDRKSRFIDGVKKIVYSATPITCGYGNLFTLVFKNGKWEKSLPNVKTHDLQVMQSEMYVDLANKMMLLAPFIKRSEGERESYLDENEFRFSMYRSQSKNNYTPLEENKFLFLDICPECIEEVCSVD